MSLDFTTIEPGTELSGKKGTVFFHRFKANNFKDQNVQVYFKSSPASLFWMKEKDLELPTGKPLAQLKSDFLIQGHA